MMTLIDQLLNTIYMPLLNLHCGLNTGKLLRELRQSERFSRLELDHLQLLKLKQLLEYVVCSVPYYQNKPYYSVPLTRSVREILAELPILTRAEIKKAGTSIFNVQSKRIQKSRTGGTTGDPLEVWKDKKVISIVEAALWRGKAWIGIKPWHKAISIQGFGKGSWYGRLRMRLLQKWLVQAFQLKQEDRIKLYGRICYICPKMVEGYVTDLLSLSEGQDISYARVQAVLTTGEMLYPEQRKSLETAFNAPVFSYYGSNEIGALAFECEHGAMHITDEHVIMEVVNEKGVAVWDEPGRLLVTDLDNYAMPLIRYEIGDIGILSREICPCGRSLLVLKELLGRQQDALRNEAGDKLSATFFAGHFRGIEHIQRIQLFQHDVRNIEILYEGNEQRAAKELSAVTKEIHDRLGRQMEVKITRVEQIPLTGRGKKLLIRGLKS